MAVLSPVHLKNVKDALYEFVMNAVGDSVTGVIWADQGAVRADRPFVSLRRISGPIRDGVHSDSKQSRLAPTSYTLTLNEVELGQQYTVRVHGIEFQSSAVEDGDDAAVVIAELVEMIGDTGEKAGATAAMQGLDKLVLSETYPGSLFAVEAHPADSWSWEEGEAVQVVDILGSRRFMFSINVWSKDTKDQSGSCDLASRIEASLSLDSVGEMFGRRKVAVLELSPIRNLTGLSPDGQFESRDQIDITVAASMWLTEPKLRFKATEIDVIAS